jgi:hypothetical protein
MLAASAMASNVTSLMKRFIVASVSYFLRWRRWVTADPRIAAFLAPPIPTFPGTGSSHRRRRLATGSQEWHVRIQ